MLRVILARGPRRSAASPRRRASTRAPTARAGRRAASVAATVTRRRAGPPGAPARRPARRTGARGSRARRAGVGHQRAPGRSRRRRPARGRGGRPPRCSSRCQPFATCRRASARPPARGRGGSGPRARSVRAAGLPARIARLVADDELARPGCASRDTQRPSGHCVGGASTRACTRSRSRPSQSSARSGRSPCAAGGPLQSANTRADAVRRPPATPARRAGRRAWTRRRARRRRPSRA